MCNKGIQHKGYLDEKKRTYIRMIYFIVNPTSGAGSGERMWRKIRHELDTRFANVPYTVYFSKYMGHLDGIFDELAEKTDIDRIVSVGGDGTLNETVNGLARLKDVPLVCMPGGTSNDFARSLKLPVEIAESVNIAVSTGKEFPVDSCRATNASGDFSRLFVNGLGFGYDGEIMSFAEKSALKPFLNKMGMSKLMYIIFGLRQAVACKRFSVRIEHDAEVTELEHCYMVTAMLNPFQGGGIYFAPSADSSDGLTDLICIHSRNRLKFVYHVVRALLKMPAKGKGYTLIRFKEARLHFNVPQIGQIDGECIGARAEMSFKSAPQQFRLIRNAE